jgi:hypothetical protein
MLRLRARLRAGRSVSDQGSGAGSRTGRRRARRRLIVAAPARLTPRRGGALGELDEVFAPDTLARIDTRRRAAPTARLAQGTDAGLELLTCAGADHEPSHLLLSGHAKVGRRGCHTCAKGPGAEFPERPLVDASWVDGGQPWIRRLPGPVPCLSASAETDLGCGRAPRLHHEVQPARPGLASCCPRQD